VSHFVNYFVFLITMASTSTISPVNTRSQTSKNSSNDDIMKAIKSLSTSQSTQFKELQNSITGLTSQVADLVTENASFRAEIAVLRSRVDLLESRPIQSSDLSSKIFRESAERSKIEYNVIAYGVPESAANTGALRFKDDVIVFSNYLNNISISVPTGPKLIRLGNNNANKPRPLKIICQSKDEASQLIHNFSSQVRNGVLVPSGFRIVRDKTTLERELLRKAYAELEQNKKDGSSGLTVSYVNGVPSLIKSGQKNRNLGEGSNQRPNLVQHSP
jgi:regulator of replication initiation timing